VAEAVIADGAISLAAVKQDALEAAIRQHAPLVYRIAYSVLRNHHDAEDATQETFVRVLRYRRKLEGVDDPKTWLARIGWRVAVERRRRQPEVSLSEQEMGSIADQLASQMSSAEETVIGNQTAQLLNAFMSALPEQLADPMRLSTVEELAPAEIAKILGTTESSVRSRIFRARQILKEKLAALEKNYGTRR
jgi:RNA polymerase sigma-70 factor (ECF subfamily)